jgi:DNA polymerase III epsilon subunit-like protein
MTKLDSKDILFCSLDIETSGFDPVEGEILEVGLVFFRVEDGKIKTLNEWQSTFKPAKPVSPRILALTGITEEELENSPHFSEKHQELQDLVKDSVIVGHNINFDIKFLEAFGIQFCGRSIDSLDLAQIFLPTKTSYNLESMMGFLGVDHKDAHRALADAKASLIVVERLLGYYCSFPKDLKKRIKDLFAECKPDLAYLLDVNVEPVELKSEKQVLEVVESSEVSEALKADNQIVSFPLGVDYYSYVFGALKKGRSKVLLVVPDKKVLYKIWQQGLAFPVFLNDDVYDSKRFEAMAGESSEFEDKCFVAKILVWQELNWQSKSLIDVNFAFAGNKYRNLICGESEDLLWEGWESEKVLAIDHASFIAYPKNSELLKRKTIILDLNAFEEALSEEASEKVSWQDFVYAMKQIYDPISGYGRKRHEREVLQGLEDIDLFFGMATISLKKINPADYAIRITSEIQNGDVFKGVCELAEQFLVKMENLNHVLSSQRLKENVETLRKVLLAGDDMVLWLEMPENRLVFHADPKTLTDLAQNLLNPYKKLVFTASLGSDSLKDYFCERLGLKNMTYSKIGQQGLRNKIEFIIPSVTNNSAWILEKLKECDYPAAVLLQNNSVLKDFYEPNFKDLQAFCKVWAQNYSGGAGKLLENFGLEEKSLLLATDNFILRNINGRKARVKTLVLSRLPFEVFTALAEKYQNQFAEFSIPRALNNFHNIIRFFYSEDLEKVYLLDPKINKEYGKYFLEYIKSLPFVEIKYI